MATLHLACPSRHVQACSPNSDCGTDKLCAQNSIQWPTNSAQSATQSLPEQDFVAPKKSLQDARPPESMLTWRDKNLCQAQDLTPTLCGASQASDL